MDGQSGPDVSQEGGVAMEGPKIESISEKFAIENSDSSHMRLT